MLVCAVSQDDTRHGRLLARIVVALRAVEERA
jgi:hypothetical protein